MVLIVKGRLEYGALCTSNRITHRRITMNPPMELHTTCKRHKERTGSTHKDDSNIAAGYILYYSHFFDWERV